MKIQIKYDIVILDDNGEMLVDAKAEGNFNDVAKLVSTVVGAITTISEVIETAEKDTRARTGLDDVLKSFAAGNRVSQ